MASSPSSASAQAVVPTTGRENDRVEWLIVVMKRGEPTVYKVELGSRPTGTTALYAIIRAYKEAKPHVLWYHTGPRLEDAVISSFTINADPEAQDYPRLVIIKSTEPLPELTKAFANHALLNGTGRAVLRDNEHMNVASGLNKIDGHYHAIFIKTEASRWLLAVGVLVSIAVSVVIGFVVGYMTGKAVLGVAAGAAIISVMTFVQGCAVFFK